jgi:predicted DNA-binding transcriptional regulator YafY
MPANKSFQQRIELLDQCLRTKGRKWTLNELRDFLNSRLFDLIGREISKRTLQDDLQYLREKKSAPLKRLRVGASNYFYYTEPFSLKNLPVSEEEVTYLRDAIKILRQVNDFGILKVVETIISKLEQTINTNVPDQNTFIQFEKPSAVTGNQYIDTLFVAIREKLSLRIGYQPFNMQNPRESLFHPYLLKEYRNRWFLLCREKNAQQVTTLALDRIKYVKNSADSFLENDLFDSQTYFDQVIGVSIPEIKEVSVIEMKVSASQAPYIITKPVHHSQKIAKEYKNGDLLIQFTVMQNFELLSLLLGFGNNIEVIKPLSLRNNIELILESASARYKNHKK